MKQPQQLISEQLPNDGSHQPSTYLKKANERLKEAGKHGKTATIKVSGKNLALQFSFEGQRQKGINQPFTIEGVKEAERLARIVSAQLEANQFTWDWFNGLLGKPVKQAEAEKQLTCDEMLKVYKAHYFKEKANLKSVKNSWYQMYRNIEGLLADNKQAISREIVRQVVESTSNNTAVRGRTLNGLESFLSYFDIDDYEKIINKYREGNNPKRKKRNVPSDKRIIHIYNTGFHIIPRTPEKYYYRPAQWQFLYGLLATYGLRIHEAWNIKNWDTPVTLKNGDWVSMIDAEDNEVEILYEGNRITIPGILDPKNKDKILCIGHETKTGYRMAIPLSPDGHDWIEEFDLIQPLNLPDLKNPLSPNGDSESSRSCATQTCRWFRARKYGFTPHDLRHAYNHRGHNQGVSLSTLCQSLGHLPETNTSTYFDTMSDDTKLKGMLSTLAQVSEKKSSLEIALKRIEELETENSLLKTKLKMYEAIVESKST
ncbi:MAG: hypothetical protein ACFCU5_18600 [Pleurocapsa sp.]